MKTLQELLLQSNHLNIIYNLFIDLFEELGQLKDQI